MTDVSRTSYTLDVVIRCGCLFVLVFAALAHGVVEPWSRLLFELGVTALFFLWAFKAYQERRLELRIPALVWPLLGLIGIGVLQSFARIDADGMRRSLSYDVDATRGAVWMLVFLLVCALLFANFFSQRAELQSLAKFLPVYGTVLAVLAILQHFTARQSILWVREISGGQPFGTFVNRDHFAGYMELLIGLPVALIATREVRGEGRFLYVVAAMMMGLAAVLTLSRGGAISLVLELILIGALANRRARQFNRSGGGGLNWLGVATVGLVLAAIAGGVLWIGAEPVINRFATGSIDSSDLSKAQSFESARGALWRDTWLIVRAHPILGAGLGAYETAFHIFGLNDDDDRAGIAAQAHNDYLQVLADAGLVGGLLMLWFLVLVLRGVFASVRQRDPLLAGVALGASGGILGMLVHSFFDFNLQLASHALLFLLLCVVVLSIQTTADQGTLFTARTVVRTPATTPALTSEVLS